jgi:glucose/arabinose dehydrogenase
MAHARAFILTAVAALTAGAASAEVRTGAAAFGDWQTDAPGVVRKITPADLPPILATPAATAASSLAPRPEGAGLKVLPGFKVEPFAKLESPRLLRVAPNGDVFVAETNSGRITILRAKSGADKPDQTAVFADGLDRPFGIAFYPLADPQWVYIANVDSVIRFPYRAGDLKARGPAETLVPKLTETKRGHSTRDVAFSADGRHMFISVGSASNVAEQVPVKTPEETKAWAADHALGADWGTEAGRADVLIADPDGKNLKVFAAGIRNCVGLAIEPRTKDVWCATNERDLLGDDLPSDYVTRVKAGGFYGWPWYYIGDHEDPRPNVKGQRPDLKDKITVPDVLIQPHSAPLEMTFYTGANGPGLFPVEYRGDAFVALHGSWNRKKRTGYKVVRVMLKNGIPTGEYEDFLTGFVIDDQKVWGRPVGVATARDGALLIADDGGNMIWRVSYKGPEK